MRIIWMVVKEDVPAPAYKLFQVLERAFGHLFGDVRLGPQLRVFQHGEHA